jgi:hypothetical protein
VLDNCSVFSWSSTCRTIPTDREGQPGKVFQTKCFARVQLYRREMLAQLESRTELFRACGVAAAVNDPAGRVNRSAISQFPYREMLCGTLVTTTPSS